MHVYCFFQKYSQIFSFALQVFQAHGQRNAQSVLKSIFHQVYRIENCFLNPFKIQLALFTSDVNVIDNKKAH